MKTATLSRRLLAGVAGLAVGLVSALGLAAPVHAVTSVNGSYVEIIDVCDGGTYLAFDSADVILVWVDDAEFWPGAGGAGDNGTVLLFVSSYEEIVVDFTDDVASEVHEYQEPDFCAELPEPTLTAATCAADATITIPAAPMLESNELYALNGADFEPESTHTVEPGTHTVQLLLRSEDGEIELQAKAWTFPVDAPECPEETVTEPAEPGTAELAATGSPTLWMAGAAVALLVIGGGLFFLTRRRNVDFTA